MIAKITHAEVIVRVRVCDQEQTIDEDAAQATSEHHPVLLPQRFEAFLLQSVHKDAESQQKEAVYYRRIQYQRNKFHSREESSILNMGENDEHNSSCMDD